MNVTLLRLGIALTLIGAGVGVYLALNRRLLARNRRKSMGLESFEHGRPGVLYFTMEGCLPCKTAQRPALHALQEMAGGQIQIIVVDTVRQPEMTSHWGVLSVPTTLIIDPMGRPRTVNHGVAREQKLRQQIEAVAGPGWFQSSDSSSAEAPATTTGLD